MKRSTLLILAMSLLVTVVVAQDVPVETSTVSKTIISAPMQPRLMPEAKDFGVTVNVAGLINNISLQPREDLLNNNAFLIRYVQSEPWTIRIGVSPMVYRFNQTATDSVGKDLVEFDSTASRSAIAFRPGVEYHLKGSRRLDPYVALDGEIGFVGGLRIGSVTNITDTTGSSRIARTITEDGGFSLGVKLSAGMNYFIAKRLFVGLEYGLGLRNVVSGGDRQEVVQIEPVSGTNQTIRDLSSQRTNDLNLFVDPMAMITIGYFFGQ